jgi:PAS domain S-box-containing protein
MKPNYLDATDRRCKENLRSTPSDRIEKSSWFRALVESSTEPITVVSASSGRFVTINSAFARKIGFDAMEMVGKNPLEIGFLEDRRVYDDFLRDPAAHSGKEFEFRTSKGEIRCGQASSMSIEVAGQRCLIIIWHDVTERNQFESDMARARDLALESAQLRSDFLSNISHELRTPLNGIVAMSELLVGTALTSEQREYADTIETSSKLLLKLVTDILDFSTASSGELRFEKVGFGVRHVVQTAVSLYHGLATDKGLELVLFIDPTIPNDLIGDPHRLGQILNNLLNNAIKFTHSGVVTVRVLPENIGEDSVVLRFEVQDTGIGISGADQERVFRPFVQADGSTTRKYGGTGLGLAICTRLVNMMGGRLDLRSSEGCGSVFYFSARFALPHADSDQRSKGPAQEMPQPAEVAVPCAATGSLAQLDRARVYILIVEDNVTNQLVLRRQLEKLGYVNLTIVNNGQEALTILGKTHHDIVMMDCQMPLMDGFETTDRIRSSQNGRGSTFIIALTAHALTEDREKCIAAGMDDYITKPVALENLSAALERWQSLRAGC